MCIRDSTKRLNVHRGTSYESWEENRMVIAGSPETVISEITQQAGMLGINYLLTYLFFGSMAFEDAMRSFKLFQKEVMPKLAEI